MSKTRWKRFEEGYTRFVEKQGFAVIITVCVAVITGTAVWTKQQREPYAAPTPPVMQDVSAAQLIQESMKNAATPSPAPTDAPVIWVQPVKACRVLQAFDGTRMVQSGVTGIWALHDAIDLAADAGEPIAAMAEGVVTACGQEGIRGSWVQVEHPEGVVAEYAGMSLLAAIEPGDRVRAGQTLGFGGNGMVGETDLGPHLHLRITRDGTAIDPVFLLEKASTQK